MVRIKVKTLIIGLALLLAMTFILFRMLPDWTDGSHKASYSEALGSQSGVLSTAELYQQADEASPGASLDGFLYLFPRFSSSSPAMIGEERLQYAAGVWEQLIRQAPDSDQAKLAYEKLVWIYMNLGQLDAAELSLAKWAAASEQQWERELIDSITNMLASRHSGIAEEGTMLSGTVNIGGKPAEGVFVFLHGANDPGWHSPPIGKYPTAVTNERGQYAFSDVPPGAYDVGIGIAANRLNGYYLQEGVAEVVHLLEGGTVSYSVDFVPRVEIISPEGNATITGEKLELQWVPYANAAYYRVFVAPLIANEEGDYSRSRSSMALPGQWEAAQAGYSLHELRLFAEGFSKGQDSGGEVWIAENGILGAVFPGGHFTWYVEAYDTSGKRLSSSAGYYLGGEQRLPFFHLPEAGMLEGDRLLLKGEYEAAVASYEQEGANPWALRALARLALAGLQMEHKPDYAQALYYLQQIPNPEAADIAMMAQMQEELGGRGGK